MSYPLCYTNHMMKMKNEKKKENKIILDPSSKFAAGVKNLKKIMKNKHYYTKLHAIGIKPTAKHYARGQVCAHFSTPAKVDTIAFEEARNEAIEFYWNQQKRGWESYMVGKTYKQTGHEDVSVMCPSYSEGHRSQPTYEEVI